MQAACVEFQSNRFSFDLCFRSCGADGQKPQWPAINVVKVICPKVFADLDHAIAMARTRRYNVDVFGARTQLDRFDLIRSSVPHGIMFIFGLPMNWATKTLLGFS